jgi:hypothetical protein
MSILKINMIVYILKLGYNTNKKGGTENVGFRENKINVEVKK